MHAKKSPGRTRVGHSWLCLHAVLTMSSSTSFPQLLNRWELGRDLWKDAGNTSLPFELGMGYFSVDVTKCHAQLKEERVNIFTRVPDGYDGRDGTSIRWSSKLKKLSP